MAEPSNIRTGFDNVRVAVLFGITLFGCGLGSSNYIYTQKMIHRKEINLINSTLDIEVERRADNEMLITRLEGDVSSLRRAIEQDSIRQEQFIYDLSLKIIDNRVMLSDWISHSKSHKTVSSPTPQAQSVN